MEADSEIVALATALTARVWDHYSRVTASLGLSGPESKALSALVPGKQVPMRVVADRMHANPSNVSVVISRLESRGLIVRQGGDDRRVKGVQLTPAGEELKEKLNAAYAEGHPALRGLSDNQKVLFLKVLRRLAQD
ncbi:MarR family winged helix-turn-helix transcriptional regulator [Fodinicola acaciae]|uniref:MarR family winged helix-turn-helix transcriptional regulator n=1 Tax=Fodinicola acaciae TaxID=2681555 RepID=UPI0013D1AD13|nr:MarR family transcriptional regulator [Fodinicola acaciae]